MCSHHKTNRIRVSTRSTRIARTTGTVCRADCTTVSSAARSPPDAAPLALAGTYFGRQRLALAPADGCRARRRLRPHPAHSLRAVHRRRVSRGGRRCCAAHVRRSQARGVPWSCGISLRDLSVRGLRGFARGLCRWWGRLRRDGRMAADSERRTPAAQRKMSLSKHSGLRTVRAWLPWTHLTSVWVCRHHTLP